jgi:hypothetical protein
VDIDIPPDGHFASHVWWDVCQALFLSKESLLASKISELPRGLVQALFGASPTSIWMMPVLPRGFSSAGAIVSATQTTRMAHVTVYLRFYQICLVLDIWQGGFARSSSLRMKCSAGPEHFKALAFANQLKPLFKEPGHVYMNFDAMTTQM